jgi:hypothetical protein
MMHQDGSLVNQNRCRRVMHDLHGLDLGLLDLIKKRRQETKFWRLHLVRLHLKDKKIIVNYVLLRDTKLAKLSFEGGGG